MKHIGNIMQVTSYLIQIEGITYYQGNDWEPLDKKKKYEKLTCFVYVDTKGDVLSIRTERLDKVPGFEIGRGGWENHFELKDIKTIEQICKKAVEQIVESVEKNRVMVR